MANELITREDVVRGKKNFDAFDKYLSGSVSEHVQLPGGQSIKTRAALEQELRDQFPPNTVGHLTPGSSRGQVPKAEDVLMTVNGLSDNTVVVDPSSDSDCNDFLPGKRYLVEVNRSTANTPPEAFGETHYYIETVVGAYGSMTQTAYGHRENIRLHRTKSVRDTGWGAWVGMTPTPATYSKTTATDPNVVVTSSGELQRATSSRVFKDDIKPIEIEDYRTALKSVQPVSYRSKHTSDNPDWSWYSFIAEDMVKIDARLVQMSDVEFYEDTDEEGNTFVNSRQLPEGEYAPSGLNFNGIVTLMARINQYMLEDIEALEAEKTQLKSRMTKLENRLEALEKQLAAK